MTEGFGWGEKGSRARLGKLTDGTELSTWTFSRTREPLKVPVGGIATVMREEVLVAEESIRLNMPKPVEVASRPIPQFSNRRPCPVP